MSMTTPNIKVPFMLTDTLSMIENAQRRILRLEEGWRWKSDEQRSIDRRQIAVLRGTIAGLHCKMEHDEP